MRSLRIGWFHALLAGCLALFVGCDPGVGGDSICGPALIGETCEAVDDCDCSLACIAGQCVEVSADMHYMSSGDAPWDYPVPIPHPVAVDQVACSKFALLGQMCGLQVDGSGECMASLAQARAAAGKCVGLLNATVACMQARLRTCDDLMQLGEYEDMPMFPGCAPIALRFGECMGQVPGIEPEPEPEPVWVEPGGGDQPQ